jgi:hypothetical protein
MMLPDFPSIKKDLDRLLQLGARTGRRSASGIMGAFPRRSVHEGDRHILVRENGEVVEDFFSTITARESLEVDEVEVLSLDETYAMYKRLMAEMDDKEEAAFIELANETAESVGNVVEGKGRPHPEVVLEGVEKMLLDPAPKDVDHLFSLPGVRIMLQELDDEAVEKAREALKKEPYRARTEHLLEQKREEYRARESSRKLVG